MCVDVMSAGCRRGWCVSAGAWESVCVQVRGALCAYQAFRTSRSRRPSVSLGSSGGGKSREREGERAREREKEGEEFPKEWG